MKLKNLLLCSLMFLFIASCGKREDDVIKIGAILPLTGEASEWGVPVRNTLMLCQNEINDAGGINGKKLKIIFEDDQAESTKGVNSINKLIVNDKPLAIIGSVASSVSLAISPIAERNKIVLISPASTNPKLTYAGDYFFRVIPTDKLRSEKFAEYIFNSGAKTLDVLFINNDGGVGATDAFVNKFISLGGKNLIKEGYSQTAVSFRTELSKVKRSNADGLVIVSYPEETSILLRQIKELGIKKRIFALTEALDDPAVIEKSQGTAEGVVYILPAPAEGKVADEFKEKYRIKYGVQPPLFAAEGYDIIFILKKIIDDNININSEMIKNALYKIKDYQGASGVISFDENGDVIKPMAIKVINGLKNTLLKIIS